MQSKTPLYYPGFAFMTLVFITSTGEPTKAAINPANAEQVKCNPRWSFIILFKIKNDLI